jgi:predicted acetyltransferase
MPHITVQVRKWGNSLGLILPREVVEEAAVSDRDLVDISIVKKKKTSGFGMCRGAGPFVEEEDAHTDIVGD